MTSFLPGFLLSGFIYAIDNMPVPIQIITHIVPARYFITVLRAVFLKGVGPEIVWGELLFLIAYAVVVAAIATKRLRRKVA
jgi:ABC-2 type transport system permease protein